MRVNKGPQSNLTFNKHRSAVIRPNVDKKKLKAPFGDFENSRLLDGVYN